MKHIPIVILKLIRNAPKAAFRHHEMITTSEYVTLSCTEYVYIEKFIQNDTYTYVSKIKMTKQTKEY